MQLLTSLYLYLKYADTMK